MHFDNISAFLAMGGYAKYVWSSFLITWVCFFVLFAHSRKEKRTLLALILSESDRKKRIEEKQRLDNVLKGKNEHESKT